MRLVAACLLAVCPWVLPASAAEADADPAAGLPVEDFLLRARRPLLQDAWTRCSGTIQQQRDGQVHPKVLIRLDIRFAATGLSAQVVLDGRQTYGIEQRYAESAVPDVRVTLPAEDGEPSLHELGIETEDITFSFLYWNFSRELESASVRGQPCRVIELLHPGKAEAVRVHFSRDYFFPLRVDWYHVGAEQAWRQLEFKDFKRRDEMWFVQELILNGPGWKTKSRSGTWMAAPVARSRRRRTC